MTQANVLAQLGAQSGPTFRNRIINGAMVISQRGTSGTATSAGSMVLDRFVLYSSNTTPAVTQSSDAPAGFVNSLLWTQSSAATRSAGDYYEIGHKIEGYNIADLNLGTANAKTFTVSFWVKSSVTGTYSFAMRNAGVTYAAYVSTYTISVANTWQQVGVTITGATAGTWNTTNGDGLELWIDLGSGSTYQTSTYNSWIYGNGNALSAASQVGFAQTNGATFYITGVQLEVGSSATGFEYRQYTTELQLCQRYYYQHASYAFTGGAATIGLVAFNTATDGRIMLTLPTTMRTYPSLVQGSGSNYYIMFCNSNNSYFSSFTGITSQTQQTAELYIQGASALTAGFAGYSQCQNAGSFIAFSAEL